MSLAKAFDPRAGRSRLHAAGLPGFACRAFGILLGLVSAASLLAAQEEGVRLKVDVRLVHAQATVRDGAGRLMPNLAAEDFEIYEQGRLQRIAVFQRESDLPLSVALLIDASPSTAKDLEFETASAVQFLESVLGPSDHASVYRFARDVDEIAFASGNTSALERAIRGIKPSSGTSLYDAVYLASRELRKQQGRKAIVVLTDGGDTTSRSTYHEALRAVQMADAAFYGIAVIPIAGESGRNTGGEHALAGLSRATGGGYYAQDASVTLEEAFGRIREELRTQYLLGYYPAQTTSLGGETGRRRGERWVPIEVKMKDPALSVNARKGYYAGGDF